MKIKVDVERRKEERSASMCEVRGEFVMRGEGGADK